MMNSILKLFISILIPLLIGGSAGFVLTHVIYLTKKEGTKMELSIFLNNLTEQQQQQLEKWLDPFEAQVIFSKKFREKLIF